MVGVDLSSSFLQGLQLDYANLLRKPILWAVISPGLS